MNTNMERFMESADSKNTQKVIKFVFKDVEEDIKDYGAIELEQFILDRKPNSPKAVITICYVIGLYAKWLNNDTLYQIVNSLDKKLLWKKSKPNVKKKFISYEQYKQVIHEISVYEDFNALYYETLFQSIYEGIYNDDLSVLRNLRKSDINENIVTLTESNGHVYKIKISDQLADKLIKLADINIWQRRNRFGICNVNMRGVYSDSVFKIENRSTASNKSFRFTFYAKLRKISKEYLEYSLLPLQLYTSGVVRRIKTELEKNNITLEEAFADNSRDRMSHLIISKELIRCNSSIEVGNFRELVKGHLDSF